jgi:phosphoribosylformimino-5-aminoimidazole carboxamide ribotide isomerase
MEIIAAMDLMDGQCVRLRQGDFSQRTNYGSDPLAEAVRFANAGIRRLHMVDLDGARAGLPKHLHVLRDVAANTNLTIDFSGGIRSETSLRAVFDAGAHLVAIGSLAAKDPQRVVEWMQHFGTHRFVLGADVRNGLVAIGAWEEQTQLTLNGFLRPLVDAGLQQAFCTDISRDGTSDGPNMELYAQLVDQWPTIRWIASGGVANIAQLQALQTAGCSGAIVGKALYDGSLHLDLLRPWTALPSA